MQGKRLFLSKNLHFYLKYSILTALDGTDDAEVLDWWGNGVGYSCMFCAWQASWMMMLLPSTVYA